jgi:hypothetical protein
MVGALEPPPPLRNCERIKLETLAPACIAAGCSAQPGRGRVDNIIVLFCHYNIIILFCHFFHWARRMGRSDDACTVCDGCR